MDRYGSAVQGRAFRILRDADAADEVAAETFLRLWRRRRPPNVLRAFLLVTAKRVALDRFRRRVARARRERRWCETELRPPATPEENTRSRELRRILDAAIRSLPDRRREAFDLIHLKGMSYKEAAKVMGAAPKTVENYVAAARRELRQKLAGLSWG